MVRRVTLTSAAVFVATSEARTITLSLRRGGTNVATSPSTPTIALGSGLHVALVEATATLEPGATYEYDLTFVKNGIGQSLSAFGLLSGAFPLGYADNALPSFRVPPLRRADLTLGQASCHKVHGDLGSDAFVALDAVIAADRAKRPHLLIHTGDQIYADDVDDGVLAIVRRAAQTWMPEVYQREVITDGASRYFPAQLAPGTREEVSSRAGLTEPSKSRLLAFSEYLCMHFATWSPVAWRSPGAIALKPAVKDFVLGVPRIRRVLANVSSLMMFDDHEVSDDWFIDETWRSTVLKTGLGRTILRNALLAYAICQDWGNKPNHYAGNGAGSWLPPYVTWDSTHNTAVHLTDTSAVGETLLDVGTHPAPAPFVWHHSLVFAGADWLFAALNTRTRRQLFTDAPPGLIEPPAITEQLPDNLPVDRTLILLSPAPLAELRPIDRLPRDWLSRDKRLTVDAEPWTYNGNAFWTLLDRLARWKLVVVLSGDVHHAYSAGGELFSPSPERRTRVIQLTSSGTKYSNYETWTERRIVPAELAEGSDRTVGWLGIRGKPADVGSPPSVTGPSMVVPTFGVTEYEKVILTPRLATRLFDWALRFDFAADKRAPRDRLAIAGTSLPPDGGAEQRSVVVKYNIALVRFTATTVEQELLWLEDRGTVMSTLHAVPTKLAATPELPLLWSSPA
jgi:hypothetical protein